MFHEESGDKYYEDVAAVAIYVAPEPWNLDRECRGLNQLVIKILTSSSNVKSYDVRAEDCRWTRYDMFIVTLKSHDEIYGLAQPNQTCQYIPRAWW